MAIRLSTSSVNTNIPGAYPEVTVKSTPVGITNTGDIVIIGEADGGADYTQEALIDNFYTSTQLDRVTAKYISGPIVDAMRALASPSNDTNIQGSGGKVYVVKTNAGTKADSVVAAASGDYGTIEDKNYGVNGNKYYYQVTQVEDEVGPKLQGAGLSFVDPSIFDGLQFDIRVNGSIENPVTLGVGTHADISALAAEIEGLLPAGVGCAADTSNDSLIIYSYVDGRIDFSGQVAGMTTDVAISKVEVKNTDAVILTADGIKDVDTLISDYNIANPDDLIQLDSGDGSQVPTANIVLSFTSEANEKGWGKSFELIDSTPGDLNVLGVAEGLVVSSQEPEIELSVKRQDTNTNEAFAVEAEVAFTIGYDGDSCTVAIAGGVLTTTVVAGSGSNLSVNLDEYTTMADLAAFVSSQAGYSATSVASSNNLSPLRLDQASFEAASSVGAEPGRAKKAAYNFAVKVNESAVVDFEFAASAGLPSEMAVAAYLEGGAKGATLASDIVNAIPALEGIKVNFVLPLFSRDYTEDIADGLTDSASTYTIDAINFAIKSHVLAMSTIKIKRNRIAVLSKDASYADAKSHAQSIASFRAVVCMQKSSQVDAQGNVKEFAPWHTAAIAVGMQSAGFYRSLTNKFANIISYKDPSGFDSGNIGDVEDAIDAGIMFLQKETAGNKWVVDQTTYGFDGNFVYNSLQAVYMSDVLAIQLAESLEKFVVGKSLADINAAAIAAFIAKKMEEYRKLKIIGASDDAPLGYKNLDIKINGPIAEVKLEAKLATAILFIPIQLELSQIQSSAEA